MEEILLHTDNIETATAEIESVGRHITLSFEDKVLVAKVQILMSVVLVLITAILMDSNSFSVCRFMRSHIGWYDG